jgi:hypothetical protein
MTFVLYCIDVYVGRFLYGFCFNFIEWLSVTGQSKIKLKSFSEAILRHTFA